MEHRIKEYMKTKNHSVAFLRLISSELYEYDKELSKRFLDLAERKRHYESLMLELIHELDNSNIIFKDIIRKAYYDYDEYNSLEFSSEKEELCYLLDMLKNEEELLNNNSTLIKAYLNSKTSA